MAIRTSFPPALPLYGWPSAGPESCGVSWRPLFGLRRCVPRGSRRGFRHAVNHDAGRYGDLRRCHQDREGSDVTRADGDAESRY